ncbi:MAG: large conductance mechanosensitive channel protein MscL [Actinobacteria bacterium]|nr:large conductance mechanosensitive channel protein MscL [Actinomycetota bacterium]
MMFKGYRDFILRGSVLDLAVGVVIGAAFTAVVSAISTGILTPLVARVAGAESADIAISIGGGQAIDLGMVINAAMAFLITSTVLYFVVIVPVNRIRTLIRQDNLNTTENLEPADVILLREILEELRKTK